MSETSSFYQILTPFPATQNLCDLSFYAPVPKDWYIAVADVKGSTIAVTQGRYKDVNVVSSSAIIAVLNQAEREKIAYVFGGDGATFLFPPEFLFPISCALHGARVMAQDQFSLDMRAGIVPVSDLLKENSPVLVAKSEIAPGVFQTALAGEGVSRAEVLVKDKVLGPGYDIDALFPKSEMEKHPPNFEGLECRWKPLQARNGLNISLIVSSRLKAQEDSAKLYESILTKIHAVCGHKDAWKPVSVEQLEPTGNPAKLLSEWRVRTHNAETLQKLGYLARAYLLTLVGKICFLFGWKAGHFDGKTYKQETATHSDYIKFDNALRMIMDITPEQKRQIDDYLKTLLQDKKITYGIHESSSALMTCLVFDYQNEHFHFIDGSDGGYSFAARQMKDQAKDAFNAL